MRGGGGLTLLGFVMVVAVVAATSCGGTEEPKTLESWASDVCRAFDGYTTADLERSSDDLGQIRLAMFDLDKYTDVDLANPPKLREDAARFISQERLLAHVALLKAADRALIEKLERLSPPPDTSAGRLALKVLDDALRKIRENLVFLREEVEKPLREEFSSNATPLQALRALDRASSGVGLQYFVGLDIAFLAGYASGTEEGYGELAQVLKDADGCDSWADAIAGGEQMARDQGPPVAHSLTRVDTCLRGRGRRVVSDKSLKQLLLNVGLLITPSGLKQHLVLRFYPTSREAHNAHQVMTRAPSAYVRRIDNVIYDRPPSVPDDVFEDIEQCILAS